MPDQVADVAHPCKPWEVHYKWSELVTEEFFKQVLCALGAWMGTSIGGAGQETFFYVINISQKCIFDLILQDKS